MDILEIDVGEQRVAGIDGADAPDADGLAAGQRGARRRIDHDEWAIGQDGRRELIKYRQGVGGARSVRRWRDDVDLQIGAQPQRLLQKDVPERYQQDAEGPRGARNGRCRVVEREDVAGSDVRGDRRRIARNRENQILGLAGGERQGPDVEQVTVSPPLDADCARLLAEVLHVQVGGARLRAGPNG